MYNYLYFYVILYVQLFQYTHFLKGVVHIMLTNSQLKALKSKDKLYRISDFNGLSIEVPVKGKLRWRFRYRFKNKAIQKSFGTLYYPN